MEPMRPLDDGYGYAPPRREVIYNMRPEEDDSHVARYAHPLHINFPSIVSKPDRARRLTENREKEGGLARSPRAPCPPCPSASVRAFLAEKRPLRTRYCPSLNKRGKGGGPHGSRTVV